MQTLLRRVLVLGALLFWQGGFTFYAAVVVHVGQDVLGSHRAQGFVTRRVTDFLNLAGAVTLPLLAWDLLAARDRSARRRRGLWACWAGMAASLAVLVWLHARLEALLDPASFAILDPGAFDPAHRWYLHASTLQWACAVAYGVLTVWAWHDQDREAGAAATAEKNRARPCPLSGERL